MYFVSTLEEDDCTELYGGAWGYFWTKESAVDSVHRNMTDMHETIYPYAIVEKLEPGLFPVPKERVWFGWDEDKEGFCEIEIQHISSLHYALDLELAVVYAVSFLYECVKGVAHRCEILVDLSI